MEFNEKRGSYIDLPEEIGISAAAFMPIASYLQTSEFEPKLVDESSSMPKLQNVMFEEQKDHVAESIAKVYNTASKLQLAGLQSLAAMKLGTLYPLTPLVLLIVAKIIVSSSEWGCDAELELGGWLADHITEYFWTLMDEHGKWLGEVLRSSEELKQNVFAKILSNAEVKMRGFDEEDEGIAE